MRRVRSQESPNKSIFKSQNPVEPKIPEICGDQILFIYNIETNLDSDLLTVAHYWIEEFAKHFKMVQVYSLHVGRFNFGENVNVIAIGGNSLRSKLVTPYKLLKSIIEIAKLRKQASVFFHMSDVVMAVASPFIKLLGVSQFLWFSHARFPTSAKIAVFFADKVFTASALSVSFQSEKLVFVRNGVPASNFLNLQLQHDRDIDLLILGRVARVKRIEEVVQVIGNLKKSSNVKICKIHCIGPISDNEYLRELADLCEELEVNIAFEGPVAYSRLPSFLSRTEILYAGTDGGVDKAAIEAAMCGCLVVSQNPEALRLVGMEILYVENGITGALSLEEQFEFIFNKTFLIQNFRSTLRDFNFKYNSLSTIVSEISEVIKKERYP